VTALERNTSPVAENDIFRRDEYVKRFEQLAQEYAADDVQIRAAFLEALKQWKAAVHSDIESRFVGDNRGIRCATDISRFQDMLICALHDFGVAHMHQSINPTSSERLAIVATGGYGRGLLAPGSDIDLLILLPYKQTAWGESLIEFILYTLWDLKFKVGHATRTVKQCVGTALDDYTIRTSLLDSRLLCGDEVLFDKFQDAFVRQVITGRSVEFIDAKLLERKQRHNDSAASRYQVEPNIKEGKGGLRDLHLLQWLLDYTGRDANLEQSGASIVLSTAEKATFRRCEGFLWTSRCHLHYLSKRPVERLSFDVQIAMAERMHYKDRAGLRDVERFMKHYFLVARDVGELTRIICSALELKQLKEAPKLNRFLDRFRINRFRRERHGSPETVGGVDHPDFVIEHGRLNIASRDAFRKDPLNIIRMFYFANENNVLLHPFALRLLRSSFSLIDKDLRRNPEANALFLELLTSPVSVENTLRKMNEADVLGHFIPEFGRIVCLMQFNMYHHYTVDEHLIRTIGVLAGVSRGDYKEEHPLTWEIFDSIENSRLLYVALLLHDIGKGLDQDHSEAGRDVALQLCPRFGLSRAETDIVAWLVENHLTMSHFAQNRDLSDLKTISDFAELVQSRERLKLLLVLTVCDIRGVGPGVWNGWKGELLRNLYYETESVLSGGHSRRDQRGRILGIIERLREKLTDAPEQSVERFIASHYDDYWLKTSLKQQLLHFRLGGKVAEKSEQDEKIAIKVVTDEFTAMTELIVYAPEHPMFLAKVAGCCAAGGASIAAAQISTTRTGFALDNFYLRRRFEDEQDELRQAKSIAKKIRRLLSGKISLAKLMKGKDDLTGTIKAFSVEPVVNLDNTQSKYFTVIEVEALDRPGLLYDVTRELTELNLTVSSAHISTYGEKAVDSFYVTDLFGDKIKDHSRWSHIRERLLEVMTKS